MSNSATSKRVFASLDGIRGLAAILVVIRHVPYFGNMWFQETYLAVDLFFILSGVVIANAYEQKLLSTMSVGQFVWMRVVRIFPLYLLGCLITGICWLVIGKPDEGNTIAIIVFALLLLPNLTGRQGFALNGPAWLLLSEMVANVVYALIVRRLTTTVLLSIMGVSLAGIVATLLHNGSLDIGYYTKDIPYGILRVGFSFFAGVLIYRVYTARTAWHHMTFKGHQIIPWLLLLLLLLVFIRSPAGYKNIIYDFLVITIVFPAVILLAMMFSPDRISAKVFGFLGLISYPIYVIHLPISKWIPVVFSDRAQMLATRPMWLGFSFLALLMILAWLLDRYFDVPVRRYFLKLGAGFASRRRPAADPAASNQ